MNQLSDALPCMKIIELFIGREILYWSTKYLIKGPNILNGGKVEVNFCRGKILSLFKIDLIFPD